MRKVLYQKTRCRVILSGNTLEVYDFQIPIAYNFSGLPIRPRGKNTELEIQANRERSRNRSHKMVRRLVQANYGHWIDERGKPYFSKFLTLTFRENILSVKEANPHFTLFIKRLNYKLFKSKKSIIHYLAVIEFQPKSKRVHYHILLFNLPFIDRYIDVFNEAWAQGYIWIKKMSDERGAARYITKYMTKEDDKRLRGHKSYFRNRGLLLPAFVLKETVALQVKNSMTSIPALYEKSFENKYTGKSNYACYDIANNPELKELILANQQ